MARGKKHTPEQIVTLLREMRVVGVGTSMPALRLARVLKRPQLERGLPERIVIDQRALGTCGARADVQPSKKYLRKLG